MTRRTLVLAADGAGVRAAIAALHGPVRWLCLADGPTAAEACVLLRARADAEELDRGARACARRDVFRDRYVAFLAAVNTANHSRFWWAMPFTTKNPLATSLCRDVFEFLLVTDLAVSDPRPLVVVLERDDLFRALAGWGRRAGLDVIAREGRLVPRLRGALRRSLPLLAVLTALPAVHAWWRARRQPVRDAARGAVGIFTLVHPHTFTGATPRDAYFGRLPQLLAERGVPAVVLGFAIERPGERVIERMPSAGWPLPFVSVESCLSARDVATWLAHALVRGVRPFRLTGPTTIGGRDVRPLLEAAIRHACRDGGFLRHVGLYYATRAVARRFALDRLLYPYENRAFEKMILQGMREVRPDTRLVGYNHAAVTRSHTNFLLGEGEAKIMPLPDALLTLGPLVKEWLDAEGNYPPGMVQTAAALRQDPGFAESQRAPARPLRTLLVTLATSLTEYVKVLSMLEAAVPPGSDLRLRIRPHPTLRLEDGLRLAGLGRTDFFEVDEGALATSLQGADAVLYASSTVGVEAVALGIPALYLDLQDFLDTDPMAGWSDLKWTVRHPGELRPVLAAIAAIGDAEFAERQGRARAYAERYFGRVDQRAVQVFLDA